MGDIFSLGFGPFRWVCTSGDPTDLETTDTVHLYIILAWEPSVAQGSHSYYRRFPVIDAILAIFPIKVDSLNL